MHIGVLNGQDLCPGLKLARSDLYVHRAITSFYSHSFTNVRILVENLPTSAYENELPNDTFRKGIHKCRSPKSMILRYWNAFSSVVCTLCH